MDKLDYSYMVATAYSGSTLLAMLLDTHPQVATIGELDNSIGEITARDPSSPYICSCGMPIRQCGFFREVQERCAHNGIDLDLHNFRTRLGQGMNKAAKRFTFGVPGRGFWFKEIRDSVLRQMPPYHRHVRKVLERSEAIARTVLHVSNKKVFVDGSKDVARAFHLLHESTLDLKLIHIVRDVRAFMHSRLKRVKDGFEKGVRYWVRTHSATMQLREQLPADRYYMFRWEDFCRAPREKLNELCSFLGVPQTELLSRVNDRPHHVIGNGMRLKSVDAIRRDESWREGLTGGQLAVCDRIAGELNRSFGYEAYPIRRRIYSTPTQTPTRQVA